MAEPIKVFLIPGRFVVGERMEDHEVESKAEAERLAATGGFALSQKEANEQAFSTPEATAASTDNLKVQPEATAAPEQPKE
jgi:hypothetical protein